jgi:hypothetical protein
MKKETGLGKWNFMLGYYERMLEDNNLQDTQEAKKLFRAAADASYSEEQLQEVGNALVSIALQYVRTSLIRNRKIKNGWLVQSPLDWIRGAKYHLLDWQGTGEEHEGLCKAGQLLCGIESKLIKKSGN